MNSENMTLDSLEREWNQVEKDYDTVALQLGDFLEFAKDKEELLTLFPATDQYLTDIVKQPGSILPSELENIFSQLEELKNQKEGLTKLITDLEERDRNNRHEREEICEKAKKSIDEHFIKVTPDSFDVCKTKLKEFNNELNELKQKFDDDEKYIADKINQLDSRIAVMEDYKNRYDCQNTISAAKGFMDMLPKSNIQPSDIATIDDHIIALDIVQENFRLERNKFEDILKRVEAKADGKADQTFIRKIPILKQLSESREKKWRNLAEEIAIILDEDVAKQDATPEYYDSIISWKTAWGVLITILAIIFICVIIAGLVYIAIIIIAVWLGISIVKNSGRNN